MARPSEAPYTAAPNPAGPAPTTARSNTVEATSTVTPNAAASSRLVGSARIVVPITSTRVCHRSEPARCGDRWSDSRVGVVEAARDAQTIEHLVDLPPAPIVRADDLDGLDDRRGRPRPLAEVLGDRRVELLVAGTGRLGEHSVDDPEREGP